MIVALAILTGGLACLASAFGARKQMPSRHVSIRTQRLPGDTEEHVYDRLLEQCPTHQAELENGQSSRSKASIEKLHGLIHAK